MTDTQHLTYMHRAMELAELAQEQGEVPCGAVVVKDGVIVGEGWNQVITLNDPAAHAEVMAIRQAGNSLGNYRLSDCALYVTLEPCPMCAGLLVHSRISHLYYAAKDLKTGAAGSIMNLCQHQGLNHQIELHQGLLAEECSAMLSNFFKARREQKKKLKELARLQEGVG